VAVRRAPFLALFAASGAAALIYEVVWTRLLTLHMGHGLAAASTVLAAFMGGLAIGAFSGGRVAATTPAARALRVYAALEIAIGVLALVIPIALDLARPLLGAAYADGAGGLTFAFLRLNTAIIILTVPAACMGATFPIALRWMLGPASSAAQEAGTLYAANTLGAAVGAALSGFWLIPTLGLHGSTLVGVGLNALVAAGAWALASRAANNDTPPTDAEILQAASDAPRARPSKSKPKSAATPPIIVVRPWLAAAVFGVSGFFSLTIQVVWTRLLAQILGPTTYAFSTVVAIFIIGLAGGSAIAAPLAARTTHPAFGLACAVLASVGLALGAATGVDWALLSIAEVVARPDIQFADVLRHEVVLVATLLLPMTLAFGAAFPFAVAMATDRGERATENIGLVYACNTIGAILGSLLAGFALIPTFGLYDTIQLSAMLAAVTTMAVVVWETVGRLRMAGLAIAAVVVAGIVALPPWNSSLLSSGAYKYASALRGPTLEAALTAGELLSYREGATGTVAVRRLTGTVSLAIDGKVDASNAGDMLTQRLLAHLPLLLHPNPRTAAIIGLGSGVTLGAALSHPIAAVTVMEISPEVVDASRFFERENHKGLADPRTRLVVGDGRTHLMLGRERFDMIVSEPSNPWMAGIASLFTREFFESAKDRLAPGGVLCQWAHTYDIGTDDLKSIVATFLSVFPHGTLWLVGDADVLLVGSTEPLDDRIAAIAQTMARPGVREDLASVNAHHPFSLATLFVAQGDALKAWADGAPLQTDNRAALEFTGPRHIFGRTRDDNAVALRAVAASSPKPAAIQAAISAATPSDWKQRGLMFMKAEAHRPAYDDLTRALEANPDDPEALDALVRAAATLYRMSDAQALVTRLASDPARVPAKLTLSRILASQGQMDEAVRIPFTLLQTDPGNVPALEQLASVLSDIGDAERLEPVAMRLVQQSPKNAWGHYYAASLFFLRNRPDLALQAARNAVAIDPANAKAHNLVGASLASMGRRDEARAAFEASIAADPREAGTYTNLATLELQSGNVTQARRYFAEALTIDPNSPAALEGYNSIR
jgi:spermidine synthase